MPCSALLKTKKIVTHFVVPTPEPNASQWVSGPAKQSFARLGP